MDDSLDILLTPKETKVFLNTSIPTLNKLVRQGVFHKYHFPESKRVYYKKRELLDALVLLDPMEKQRDKLMAIILKGIKKE